LGDEEACHIENRITRLSLRLNAIASPLSLSISAMLGSYEEAIFPQGEILCPRDDGMCDGG
jgi:hypothetical protein